MGDSFRFVRFMYVWIVLFFIGRLVLGATGVPYAAGTAIFSLVILSDIGALIFGGFSRATGHGIKHALFAGAAISLFAQVLILVMTALSYLLGIETYFNHPTALNVEEAIPLGQAMGVRAVGLVANTITAAIVACIGWAMGKMIPAQS
jgi:hypothetical protein